MAFWLLKLNHIENERDCKGLLKCCFPQTALHHKLQTHTTNHPYSDVEKSTQTAGCLSTRRSIIFRRRISSRHYSQLQLIQLYFSSWWIQIKINSRLFPHRRSDSPYHTSCRRQFEQSQQENACIVQWDFILLVSTTVGRKTISCHTCTNSKAPFFFSSFRLYGVFLLHHFVSMLMCFSWNNTTELE